MDDALTRLITTSARLTRLARRTAQGSTAEWRAMAILDEHGALRVTEFAALDRLSQPSATAILKRLGVDGLVRRTPDPADGRASLVELTDAGRVRLAALRAEATDAIAPRLATLTDTERATLRAATDLLTRVLDAPDPERTR